MLNEFWQSSGLAYRVIVFSAMAALAIGLVLTIIGANIGNSGVMWTGMPFLGLGMLLHVIGIGVRGRAVSRRLKDAHAKQSQTGSN